MPYKSITINHYVTKTCLFLGFLCDIGFNLINVRGTLIDKLLYTQAFQPVYMVYTGRLTDKLLYIPAFYCGLSVTYVGVSFSICFTWEKR